MPAASLPVTRAHTAQREIAGLRTPDGAPAPQAAVLIAVEDEKAFEELWRGLGLSVDWTMTYQTIDGEARATSQLAFLKNLAHGEAYMAEAPTLWDVTFRTAVAQAELEDRERSAAFHRLAFHQADGTKVSTYA